MSDLFAAWYDRTCTVHVDGGRDEWGATLPGTDVVVPCRISEEIQLVRNADGEEIASSVTIHAALNWAAIFRPDTRVIYWSPASDGDRTTQVISTAVNLGDPDLEGIAVHLT